jgi:hypothetical protein
MLRNHFLFNFNLFKGFRPLSQLAPQTRRKRKPQQHQQKKEIRPLPVLGTPPPTPPPTTATPLPTQPPTAAPTRPPTTLPPIALAPFPSENFAESKCNFHLLVSFVNCIGDCVFVVITSVSPKLINALDKICTKCNQLNSVLRAVDGAQYLISNTYFLSIGLSLRYISYIRQIRRYKQLDTLKRNEIK